MRILTLVPFTFVTIFATIGSSQTTGQFFGSNKMYYFRITNWPYTHMTPWSLRDYKAFNGAKVEIFRTNPHSSVHCPDADSQNKIFEEVQFKIRTSGNKTNGTPKSSYKLKFKDSTFFGMTAINLKSMWNDVSQMREAISWTLFNSVGIPAPRHTYAKFCINGKYYGLYSVVENVDEELLKNRFSKKNSKGNLYKAQWENDDLGPATFQISPNHKSGMENPGQHYYRSNDKDHRTYDLKTNKKLLDTQQSHNDIAQFIESLHRYKPNSKAFFDSMNQIMDMKGFLRWAALNMLIGAWDNYWATPSNFYVYNRGPLENPKDFMSRPFFFWIPWDYDNSFGITYFNTNWQWVDIVDWEASTKSYYGGRKTSHLPLIRKVLQNKVFLKYYLSKVNEYLDKYINLNWMGNITHRLWNHVKTAVYLEADLPNSSPHTGRQFTNDLIYKAVVENLTINHGNQKIWSFKDYISTRHVTAKKQLLLWKSRLSN